MPTSATTSGNHLPQGLMTLEDATTIRRRILLPADSPPSPSAHGRSSGSPSNSRNQFPSSVPTRSCSAANGTQWRVRTMAAAAALSASTIQRIWSAHGLKPHLAKTFKLSREPNFAAKV
jgi:hypothetical protein